VINALWLTAALTLGAPTIKDPPKKGIDIVGEWIVESQEQDGKPVKPIAESMTFAADGKWARTLEGKLTKNSEKYVLDATAKPATLDLLFTRDTALRGLFGIVRVNGDTLTFCYSYRSDVRASKFEAAEGSGYALVVMKRKKKE
jgi:uncharacterized protein (TIGR03067 family)